MSENYTAAYKGLKVFRDAMLSFLIGELQAHYGHEWWERGVRPCFPPADLEHLKDQFARRYGRSVPFVFRPGNDLYEILDVNHFANVLEYNWKRVFAGPFGGERTALTWLREVVALRNAVSHPETGDLRYDDVWRGLDTAERILRVVDDQAAAEIAAIKESLRRTKETVVMASQWKEYCRSLIDDYPQWTEMLVPSEALTFVPARLSPPIATEKYPSLSHPRDAGYTSEAKPMAIDDCVREVKGPLVILGSPGQGKTAILESLTIKYAREVIEDRDTLVPVLVKLNRYVQGKRDLLSLISMSIKSRGRKVDTRPVEQLLENPGALLLLMFDGLDEVRVSEVAPHLTVVEHLS